MIRIAILTLYTIALSRPFAVGIAITSMMMNLLLPGMLTATCAVGATLSRSLPTTMMMTMSAEVSFLKLHLVPLPPRLLQDILPLPTTTTDTEDPQ